MGSGVLLAALVVLWFVVLVPMVVTRGDARPAEAGVGRLGPDAASGGGRWTPWSTPRPSAWRSTVTSCAPRGELKVDVHALRRRTLAGLVALAVLTLAGAVRGRPWLLDRRSCCSTSPSSATCSCCARPPAASGWPPAGPRVPPPVRRCGPRARAAAGPSGPRRGADPGVRRRPGAAARGRRGPAAGAAPEPPAGAGAPARPGRVRRRRAPAPAGWQSSAVVGLDDDDIGFADIDVYQPRGWPTADAVRRAGAAPVAVRAAGRYVFRPRGCGAVR